MYQGKYNHSEKNGRFAQRRTHGRRRSLLVLVSVFVLTFAMVGGTLAYLAANTEPVVNNFTYGEVPNTIPEDINGGVKSNVRVTNTGNIDAFVRAQIVVTWKDASGNISGTFPTLGTDYTMDLNTTDWFQGTDGFWYCTNRVKANTDSKVLITKATKKEGVVPPEGFDLSIEILAQSVQADGMKGEQHMVETIWPVTVGIDGKLAAKQ